MAILEAGEAHVACRHLRLSRKLRRHPSCIRATLLDAHQPVRTAARRDEGELLLDPEIVGSRFEFGRRQRRAMCARRVEGGTVPPFGVPAMHIHGGGLARSLPPSRTAALAASPSPRPMKPNRSVVVALMLMSWTETRRSAARFSAIAVRCLAMRGASASTVISALTSSRPAAFICAHTSRKNTLLSAPRYR